MAVTERLVAAATLVLALGAGAQTPETGKEPGADRVVFTTRRQLLRPVFAPDGQRIYLLASAVGDGQSAPPGYSVLEIPLAGGEAITLAEVGLPVYFFGPQPLEDGSGLVYEVRREDTNANGELDLLDLGGLVFRPSGTEEERPLMPAKEDALLLGVLRRGTRLAVRLRGQTTRLVACDVPSQRLVDFGPGLTLYGADPAGRRFVVGPGIDEDIRALTIHDFEGGARELPLKDVQGRPRYLRWRGGAIFLCAGGAGGKDVRIYRSGPAGEGPWRVWAGPLDLISSTAFHPFAEHVLLLERRPTGAALVAVDVTGERRELVQAHGEPRLLHEDRQRQRLIFGLVQGADYRLLSVIAGARATLLETRWSAAGLGHIALSPDGSMAARVVEDIPPGEEPDLPPGRLRHTWRVVLRELNETASR